MGRLNCTLDTETLLLIYKSLIVPIFDFADIIYHNLNQADGISSHFQNSVCGAILKANHYAHISDMYDELYIPTLYQQCCQHMRNMLHKFLNGNGPAECIEMFRYRYEIHHIPTRRAAGDLLYILPTNLKFCERDFAIMAQKSGTKYPLI